MSDHDADATACNCPASDAWRCAVARRAAHVACSCRCHRAPAPVPPPGVRLLLDEPVTRIAPKSDYLQKLDDDHAARQRAATAPQNVVALRARRTTTKG